MQQLNQFKKFLNKSGIGYDEFPSRDSVLGAFRFYENIENGPRVVILVLFYDNNTVEIAFHNIAKIESLAKREALHNLVNDLNQNYRFSKIIAKEDGEIEVSYTYLLQSGIDCSEIIFELVIVIFNAVKDSYPKLMKLQWQ